MKRISLVLLAITVMAVLAISASAANTVMYSGGGAAQNLVQGDAGALVIELKFDGEDAENPQTFNVDDSDALYVRFFVEDADALTGNGQIEISSSGTCDQQEYNYNPFAYEIVSGWNELELYLWEGFVFIVEHLNPRMSHCAARGNSVELIGKCAGSSGASADICSSCSVYRRVFSVRSS